MSISNQTFRLLQSMDYVIRALTVADEPLLWAMLYHGVQLVEGEPAPSRDIIRQPEFARHVEGWGRAGDTGFVAHDTEGSKQPLGAAWFRLPSGTVSEKEPTPELAFAVKRGHRRHGIG